MSASQQFSWNNDFKSVEETSQPVIDRQPDNNVHDRPDWMNSAIGAQIDANSNLVYHNATSPWVTGTVHEVDEEKERANAAARAQNAKTNQADAWFEANRFKSVPLVALQEDLYKVPGQNFICFSLIKPDDYGCIRREGGNPYTGMLMKFRGAFATKEDAEHHIQRVMSVDKNFDVFMVQAFNWVAVDADEEAEHHYAEPRIAEIMKNYFKNENESMKGLQERIRLASDGTIERSDEASDFFHNHTRFEKIETEEELKRREHYLRNSAMPRTSLTDLARRAGLDDATANAIEQRHAQELANQVSEIILEDDDDSSAKETSSELEPLEE